jgi:hypothetical protein
MLHVLSAACMLSMTNGAKDNSSPMSILNDLYDATAGSSWTYNNDDSAMKWNFTTDGSGAYVYDPCSDKFAGVSCKNDVIKSLDVTNFGLSGYLYPSLGNLDSVQELSLGTNHITGTIPTTLSLLTAVHNLDLSNNMFSGSLPHELCQINAKSIDISENPDITCYDQCFGTTDITVNCDDEVYYC